jgi:hypothetical protein
MDPVRRAVAIESLQGVVTRSRRASVVGLHSSFIRGVDGFDKPPLARLIQGGRGGEIRLKLFLCMTLIATRSPHAINDPFTPMYWARLLALDPNHGPRRVSVGLKWLKDNSFIALEPRKGNLPKVQLLDPRTGANATRPTGNYVEVPLDLWSQGWIVDLSATGLALLLILLDARGPHRSPRYITTPAKACYGLSADTWTRARKELKDAGLLAVGRTPQGGTFDYRRLRNTYSISDETLKRPMGAE